jgi:hypothetical protein
MQKDKAELLSALQQSSPHRAGPGFNLDFFVNGTKLASLESLAFDFDFLRLTSSYLFALLGGFHIARL